MINTPLSFEVVLWILIVYALFCGFITWLIVRAIIRSNYEFWKRMHDHYQRKQ
jgi:hypothetical protein